MQERKPACLLHMVRGGLLQERGMNQAIGGIGRG